MTADNKEQSKSEPPAASTVAQQVQWGGWGLCHSLFSMRHLCNSVSISNKLSLACKSWKTSQIKLIRNPYFPTVAVTHCHKEPGGTSFLLHGCRHFYCQMKILCHQLLHFLLTPDISLSVPFLEHKFMSKQTSCMSRGGLRERRRAWHEWTGSGFLTPYWDLRGPKKKMEFQWMASSTPKELRRHREWSKSLLGLRISEAWLRLGGLWFGLKRQRQANKEKTPRGGPWEWNPSSVPP